MNDEAAFNAELGALAKGDAMPRENAPLPRWIKREPNGEQPAIDGFVCDDLAAMSFALGVAFAPGFSIPYFDLWLDSIGPCGARNELMVRRWWAYDAFRAKDDATLRRHLEWMYLRRRMIDAGMAKDAIAGIGEAFVERQRTAGQASAAIRQKNAASEWQDACISTAKRELRAGKNRRELPTMLAERYGRSVEQVRRVLRANNI